MRYICFAFTFTIASLTYFTESLDSMTIKRNRDLCLPPLVVVFQLDVSVPVIFMDGVSVGLYCSLDPDR